MPKTTFDEREAIADGEFFDAEPRAKAPPALGGKAPAFNADEYIGLLEEFGSANERTEIRVLKRGERKSMTPLFKVQPSEFPTLFDLQEFCKQEYGGGDYQITVLVDKKIRTSKLFEIIESERDRSERLNKHRAPQIVDNSPVISEMREENNKLQSQLISVAERMMNRSLQNPPDTGKMLSNIALLLTAASPLILKLFERAPARDPADDMKKSLEMLVMLKDVFDKPDAAEPSMAGVAMNMLDKLGGPLAMALASNRPAPSHPTPPKAIDPPTANPPPGFDMASFLRTCVKGARRDVDPAAYALVMYAECAEAEVAQLLGLHAQGALLPLVYDMQPELKNHDDWCNDLLAELEALTTENAGASVGDIGTNIDDEIGAEQCEGGNDTPPTP